MLLIAIRLSQTSPLLTLIVCFICVCSGNSNGQLVADLLGGVLATLPADDLQEVFAAELDINSWNSFVHTYPFKASEVGLTVGALINELRVAIYSAGFSLIAQKTIMEHLAGSRPLDDWEPLREVRQVEPQLLQLSQPLQAVVGSYVLGLLDSRRAQSQKWHLLLPVVG